MADTNVRDFFKDLGFKTSNRDAQLILSKEQSAELGMYCSAVIDPMAKADFANIDIETALCDDLWKCANDVYKYSVIRAIKIQNKPYLMTDELKKLSKNEKFMNKYHSMLQ